MSIRSGIYIIYYKKEYRTTRVRNHYEIIPNDEKDLNKGFTEHKPEKNLNPGTFSRMVFPSGIGGVYKINTFCLYHDFGFYVTYNGGESYVLVSGCSPLVEKFNLTRIDKFGYEKTVLKNEVDLMYEKKELIIDFFD